MNAQGAPNTKKVVSREVLWTLGVRLVNCRCWLQAWGYADNLLVSVVSRSEIFPLLVCFFPCHLCSKREQHKTVLVNGGQHVDISLV